MDDALRRWCPWLNRGLEYTPPAKRELMPLGRLLGYSKAHWIPYVAHMAVVSIVATIIDPELAYPFAVIAAGAALLVFAAQGAYPELTVRGTTLSDWLLAVAVGVVGIIIWIAPYHFLWKVMFARIPIFGNEHIYLSLDYGFEFAEDAFDKVLGGLILVPNQLPVPTYDPSKLEGLWRTVFIIFRMAGAVITVPFFEELFTRSFIIRFADDEYYKRVPIGFYSKKSFIIALVIFVVAHPWWSVAVLWGLLIMWLLYYRRNLMLCVCAHAVSNLILAAYVLATGNYYLW
jgi:hypothetical protein